MRKVDGWETLDQLIADETLDRAGLTAAKLNPLGEAPKPISTTFETQPLKDRRAHGESGRFARSHTRGPKATKGTLSQYPPAATRHVTRLG